MGVTTVYSNGAPSHTYDSSTGTSSPIGGGSSSSSSSSGSSGGGNYTPEQVASINSAREANYNAGISVYSGAGATANSIATGQTAAGTGTPLYAAPSTINSGNTNPNTGISLPAPTPTGGLGSSTMTQLSGIAASARALQDSLNAKSADGTTSADSDFQTYLKSLTAPPKTADIYSAARAASGVDADQQAVNSYSAQLAAITAKAQADKLSLTGTGRGIPEAIIGGQQAEIDKEAAIQALPISAQLSAAQGNLKIAQDNLDTLFKLRSEDATNAAAYQNKLVDAVYNFADAKQKTALEALKTKNAQNFSLLTNNLNYAQLVATAATQNSQPGIAAQLMKLDPNDPNYRQNIGFLEGGIHVAQKDTSTTDKKLTASEVISLNGTYDVVIPLGSTPEQANAIIAGKQPVTFVAPDGKSVTLPQAQYQQYLKDTATTVPSTTNVHAPADTQSTLSVTPPKPITNIGGSNNFSLSPVVAPVQTKAKKNTLLSGY
jgi:hypothetical protein